MLLFVLPEIQSHTCVYYHHADECHKTNDGCGVQTETCSLLAHMKTCYTLWNGSKTILQGCWYPSRRPDCKPEACIANKGYFFPNERYGRFCCCFGDKCNEHYSVGNHILD